MLNIRPGDAMTLKKLFLLVLISAAAFSCDTSSKSSDGDTRGNQAGRPARSCIPESELIAPNILQGVKVKPEDSDSKAVVLVFNKSQICTGAAIADNVILTAAHCVVDGNSSSVRVFFYPSMSCESGFNLKKHSMSVAKLFVHEEYDPNLEADKTRGDIALVVLSEKIPEGYPVYKIANPNQLVDDPLLMYGYGKTGSKERGAGILRKTVIANSQYSVDVLNEQVRIEQKNMPGICQGDSGGPSLVMVNGELMILGINSYVNGESGNVCNGSSYQVLAFSFNSWLEGKLKEAAQAKR
jgi:trypsin